MAYSNPHTDLQQDEKNNLTFGDPKKTLTCHWNPGIKLNSYKKKRHGKREIFHWNLVFYIIYIYNIYKSYIQYWLGIPNKQKITKKTLAQISEVMLTWESKGPNPPKATWKPPKK